VEEDRGGYCVRQSHGPVVPDFIVDLSITTECEIRARPDEQPLGTRFCISCIICSALVMASMKLRMSNRTYA
jgi:hypothetical protein